MSATPSRLLELLVPMHARGMLTHSELTTAIVKVEEMGNGGNVNTRLWHERMWYVQLLATGGFWLLFLGGKLSGVVPVLWCFARGTAEISEAV